MLLVVDVRINYLLGMEFDCENWIFDSLFQSRTILNIFVID